MSFVRFADVRGHERALGVLRRSVDSGRVHHAYLFTGPAGVGKGLVARALAALVNCTSPVRDDGPDGAGSDACGRCSSCTKLAAGSQPDVLFIEPDGRQIKIDQVRELHAKTRFRPYESARRVVIVESADTLRDEAANALLKTLEEPRGDTMFVLVTSNPQRLLTTIVSRCQPVRFGALAPDTLTGILVARGVSEADARVAARLCGGSVGGALHVLETAAYDGRGELAGRLATVDRASTVELLAWADELGRAGQDLPDVLRMLRSVLRDAVLAEAGASPERLVNADLSGAIDAVRRGRGLGDLIGGIERIDEAERMLAGNVNPRMVCETLLLSLADDPRRPLAQRIPA